MDGMVKILVDLEEHNIRWARQMRRHHKSSIKWLHAQTGLFAVVGAYFLIAPVVFDQSWWYVGTAAIYGVAIFFFYKWAYPRHIRGLWAAARQEAEARIRMKRLYEE